MDHNKRATGDTTLNSDRIRERFGSYGIEVFEIADGVRRANLYSLEGQTPINRTLAYTTIYDVPTEISDEHARIMSGQSIGETFRSGGWAVIKETIATGAVTCHQIRPDVAELLGIEPHSCVAVHGYHLIVRRGESSVDYATVLELHHPDYLDVDSTQALYPTSSRCSEGPASITDLLHRFDLWRRSGAVIDPVSPVTEARPIAATGRWTP